jgi:hypothetical protein
MSASRNWPDCLLLLATALFWTSAAAEEPSFCGTWETTFGRMTLAQQGDQLGGHYMMEGVRCTLQGKVKGRRFTFTYRELGVVGEGWFEISEDGREFEGRWREAGGSEWGGWFGQRVETPEKPTGFDGLWETSFGRLRLVVEGKKVGGCYAYGGGSTIEGRVEGKRLAFKYREPDATGEGWFLLSDDGQTFQGKWRSADSDPWEDWFGARVLPVADRVWLVVLEARWESSLADREYSFGSMLRAFFNRVPRVQIRHRFFDNEEGLRRWCGELAYLAEPVVLVFASHGTGDGLKAGGKTIGPDVLASALQYAGDLRLLHFSACRIMQGDAARILQRKLNVPVSGYSTSVGWAASAVIEFIYLDFILAQRMSPARAADQLLKIAPFAGDKPIPGAVVPPARFQLLSPKASEAPVESSTTAGQICE